MRYEVGDSVYLSTRNLRTYDGKLLAKWVGPYLVTELRKQRSECEARPERRAGQDQPSVPCEPAEAV